MPRRNRKGRQPFVRQFSRALYADLGLGPVRTDDRRPAATGASRRTD